MKKYCITYLSLVLIFALTMGCVKDTDGARAEEEKTQSSDYDDGIDDESGEQGEGQKEGEEGTQTKDTTPLAEIGDISLDSNPSSQTVVLSRDVEKDGAILKVEDESSWIQHLKLDGNTITFDVEENPFIATGHRFDNITITIDDVQVGSFLVTQARMRKSPNALQWATSSAYYSDHELPSDLKTGKEITEFIYNLEKSTGGKDSYKNYPAFAYCIEMNHNPEKNMEWHLGKEQELDDMRFYSQFSDGYYWCADEVSNTYVYVYKHNSALTSKEKTTSQLVYAFRNGSMDLN